MKILLCPSTPIRPELGSSKVYIEIAEGLRRLGWEATVVGPDEVARPRVAGDLFTQPTLLRDYLLKQATRFDIVDFEHHQLPFPRNTLPPHVLLVARSVLLVHSQAAVEYPPVPNLRGRLGRLLKERGRRRRLQDLVVRANQTLHAADLINVCNEHERAHLLELGYPPEKVILVPFGLFPERLLELESTGDMQSPPVIAFVGTFDPRKGMAEFPDLVREVLREHPSARFRLLGTAGLVPTASGVLRFFPREQRDHLEVTPRFDPADLPRLLGGAAAGVFPSHCEGFPFGVLELLASGLPVFAYDSAGAPMLLPPEYLVPRGHGAALGRKVAALLASRDRLDAARAWASVRASEFRWETSSERTVDVYTRRLSQLRAGLGYAIQPHGPISAAPSESHLP